MKVKAIIFLLLIQMLFAFDVNSQTEELIASPDLCFTNKIYKENIHTPLLYRNEAEITYPIIELNSDETLYLGFDEFADETQQYYYTIVHCKANWTSSNLSPLDYIDGFVENQIPSFEFSFNTLVPYIHYSLVFPNTDLKPKISGNYIIIIYDTEKQLVLSRRFMVYEPLSEITASVKRTSVIDKMKSHQEVDFTIKTSFKFNDPYQEIMPVVVQNGMWSTAITGLKPLYVKDDELIYDYFEENCFGGGGEFRYFDIKSLRYQSDRIAGIEYKKPYHHIYVVKDETRRFKVYLNWQDINGKFLIKNSDAEKSNTESDYTKTHFRLDINSPVKNGKIYVGGWFSDWQLNDDYMMIFNEDEKIYTAEILLKQGYYNYQYFFVDDSLQLPDISFVEGNHYETENEYMILVYNKGFGARYEKLTAYKIISSKNIDFKNF